MSDLAIRVDNLGKRYQIGERERYYSLRDVLARAFTTTFRRLTGDLKSGIPTAQSEYIWALKDVSFEVKRSEVIGVIGRNGAGKSTLLKILSRITMPTEGRAEIHGRVGSLLEVGTGFHPELTGRENIYLNGVILGMRKAEIDSKFDEMVAFAEVEKFIDTPVKRYSSGMYVRLAFAVAAHLEAEILLVDEVLAVGDASFQKKCLGKMGKVAREGKTVFFVSHNMGAVQSLTTKSILLANGQLASSGQTNDVVQNYLSSLSEYNREDTITLQRLAPEHGAKIRICRITPLEPSALGFAFGQDLAFHITLDSTIQRSSLRFGLTISDISGPHVLGNISPAEITVTVGQSIYELRLKDTRLAPGTYTLSLSIGEGEPNEWGKLYDRVESQFTFLISFLSQEGTSIGRWNKSWGSIVHPFSSVKPIH